MNPIQRTVATEYYFEGITILTVASTSYIAGLSDLPWHATRIVSIALVDGAGRLG
jgi:hypothetical protein